MNSFCLKQKARYLPSGEMAVESTGSSQEYEVRGLRDISLFSSGCWDCCSTRQRTKDSMKSANTIPTRLSFQARERISRDKAFRGSRVAVGTAALLRIQFHALRRSCLFLSFEP